MARQLEVIQEKVGNVLIFNIKGAVDGSTVEQFDKTLGPIFRQRKARAIVDCSELTYINSYGLGLFVEYHRQSCLGTGRMVVCSPKQTVTKWFDRLGISSVVTVVPSRDDALAVLAARA